MSKPNPDFTLLSLLEGLNSDEADIRQRSAHALGQQGNDSAVEPLIYALKEDSSASIRKASAEALGKLGDIRAIRPLIEAFNDPDDSVALTATSTLSPELSKHSLPILIDTVNDKHEIPRVRALGNVVIRIGKASVAAPIHRDCPCCWHMLFSSALNVCLF